MKFVDGQGGNFVLFPSDEALQMQASSAENARRRWQAASTSCCGMMSPPASVNCRCATYVLPILTAGFSIAYLVIMSGWPRRL